MTTDAASRPVPGPPTVSVVIPCYDYARYLPESVGSVLGQTGVQLEVIVVDDASHDDSVAVARALQAADARVRVIEHVTNRGHIRTYNDGLRAATGEFVVLLSADDALAPGALERSAALLATHPEIGLVYGYAESFSGEVPVGGRRADGRPARIARGPVRYSTSIWAGRDWIARMCRRGTNIIVNPEAMMRRSVLEQLGWYDARLPQTADMALWLGAATLGGVGRVNGPVQAYYRVHGGNMHLTSFAGALVELRARLHTFDHFFDGAGRGVPNAAALRERAHAVIATEATRTAVRLAGSPDAADQEAAAGFAAAALEASPAARRSALWRALERRLARPDSRPVGPIVRGVERRRDSLVWAVRWRRWRRFGT